MLLAPAIASCGRFCVRSSCSLHLIKSASASQGLPLLVPARGSSIGCVRHCLPNSPASAASSKNSTTQFAYFSNIIDDKPRPELVSISGTFDTVQHLRIDRSDEAASSTPVAWTIGEGGASIEEEKENQFNSTKGPTGGKDPSLWDFNYMFHQLETWHRMHGTSYVPVHVFDNWKLGKWTRYLRRSMKNDNLDRWKVARLDTLKFQWKVSQAESEWHHQLHELRRFKLIYGDANLVHNEEQQGQYPQAEQLSAWLQSQEELLAKGKLLQARLDMLKKLGVELWVDEAKMHKYQELVGLNARERRNVRQRWKKQRGTQRDSKRKQGARPPVAS